MSSIPPSNRAKEIQVREWSYLAVPVSQRMIDTPFTTVLHTLSQQEKEDQEILSAEAIGLFFLYLERLRMPSWKWSGWQTPVMRQEPNLCLYDQFYLDVHTSKVPSELCVDSTMPHMV